MTTMNSLLGALHSTEGRILFFQTSWKDSPSQKIALEHDLCFIFGKDDISFSRKYDHTPWTENERWSFSPKKYLKIWHFFQMFRKDGIFKKIALEYDLSRIIWKDGIFSVGRKMKDDISQEIHRNMIFSVWTCSCHAPCQKNQEWSFPTKIHLRVIDILHWHSRKSPNNFLYFYGWPYRRFHILLFSEKNPGNSVYRIGVWLLLQFIRSEIFYNEESSILCTIQQ